MTQQLRCKQDLKAFAAGVIQRTKNGPRGLFRMVEPTEIVWKDVPSDGTNFLKMVKHYPDEFRGVFDHRAKVEYLLDEMGVV